MKKITDSVIILLLVSSSFAGTFIIIFPPQVGAYTLHDPIKIEGDEDFAAQAASEGWPGDGSEENPYVIEGYEITLDDGYPWYYKAIDIAQKVSSNSCRLFRMILLWILGFYGDV